MSTAATDRFLSMKLKQCFPSIYSFRIAIFLVSTFYLTTPATAQFATIFQEHLRTYSDFIPVGEQLEIHVSFNVKNRNATVTLPPELTFTGSFQVWNGQIESVAFHGQVATITVAEGTTGGEIWFFAFAKPLTQLPDTAPEVEIEISGETTRSFSFKMLYQKLTVTSDKEGPVTEGDIITYTIRSTNYSRDDLESASLTIRPPIGTDLVANSITGGGDASLSGNTLTWDSDPPNSLEVSYQVQVREILLIDPSVKEIVTDRVSYDLHASGILRRAPNVTGDPIIDKNVFSFSGLVTPLVNKLDRNELEVTLTPSANNVEIDQEFTVTATIKNITFARFEDAHLNPPSILILGDQVAELIESPTTFLPPLLNNQEGMLEYRFRVTDEGKFKIAAEAIATATGARDPTTSDPATTTEICVGCGPVDVEIIVPEGEFRIDEPFLAKVTVTSNVEEPQTITFTGDLLRTDDEEFLTFQVDPVDPFQLTREDPEKTFEAVVVPRKFGNAKLLTAIEAQSSAGTEGFTAEEDVVVDPLLITISTLPLVENRTGGLVPIVNMKIEDDPENDGQFIIKDEKENVITPKLEVTVKNISTQSVTAVLQGVDPKARDRSPVKGRVATSGNFPMDLQRILPDKFKKVEVPLTVVNDGLFDFTALIIGTVENSEKQFNVRGEGGAIAVDVPFPVEIELKLVREQSDITGQGLNNEGQGADSNGAYFVRPGGRMKIIANVNNLTTNFRLKFTGIKAEKRLNAFGAKLTSDIGNSGDAPFVHFHQVEPKGSLTLAGDVRTAEDGAPSGTVKWLLAEGELVNILNEKKTALREEDILITSHVGGWLGDDLAIRIVQDNSKEPRQDLEALEAVAYFGAGAMKGIGQWSYDTMDGIGTIGSLLGTASTIRVEDIDEALGNVSRALWEEAEMAALGWSSMSPGQKDQFILQAANNVFNRAQLLATAPFDKTSYTEAYAFTQNATFFLFNGLENAYASDDPKQIIDLYGRVSGNIAMEVLTAAVPTTKFTEYVKGAELSNLAKNKSLGKALTKQEDLLRAMKAGPVDEATARKAWGIGGQNLQDFQEAMRRLKIKGYARERAPESLNLIANRKVAIWKPEAMKPKGMSDLDLLIIGDPLPELPSSDGPVGLKAITAIFMPDSDAAIRARLLANDVHPDVIDAAIDRARFRRTEFEDYVPEFEAWKAGDGIPVPKNYIENGVPDGDLPKDVFKNFEFQRVKRGKTTIYVPQMADKNNVLKYISGDIDWVHFSNLDGTPLDPKRARIVYDSLIRCCGLQHPETVSWIRDGITVFKGKANQIAEYIRGDKALLEVSGEGARAVRVSEKLTSFAKDGRNHLVFFDGGIKSRVRATLADFENGLAFFQSKFPDRRLLAPFLWGTKLGNLLEDTTIEGKEWSISSSDDNAFLTRQVAGGVLEVFDGVDWVLWDITKEPGPLVLAPVTELTEDISIGETELPINNWPDFWPKEMAGRLDSWFEPGNVIVIDPGGPRQAVRLVVALGSLVLDRPLEFSYRAGTLVAVVPGNLNVEDSSNDSNFRILSSSLLANGSGISITWASVAGRSYFLETSDDLSPGSWISTGEIVTASGTTTSMALDINATTEQGFYRVQLVEP